MKFGTSYARELIAFAVVLLFGFALWRNPDNNLILGALIASFATAVGYYLGGSKVGSDTATANATTIAANATAALGSPDDTTKDVNLAEVGGEPVTK